jgi:Flp pilus assembly CpaE family ATPase
LYISKELAERLEGVQVDGTVIELPAYRNKLNKVSGRVYVIITGIINMADYEAIEALQAIRTTPEELVQNARSQITHKMDLVAGFEEDEEEDIEKEETVSAASVVPEEIVEEIEETDAKKPESVLIENKKFSINNLVTNKRGTVICAFSSSAGGVGKTFLTTNLACIGALNDINTVIVDMDFGGGNIDIATGLVRPDKREIIADKKAKAPKNWVTVTSWREHSRNLKNSIIRHHSGLHVIPLYPYAGEEMATPEIEEFINTLAEIFGLVVVDLGYNAFSDAARMVLALSDTVFIVAQQDDKSIGKITQFLYQQDGYSDNMKLVINRVNPMGFYKPREVAGKCGFKQYDTVPNDERGVSAAVKRHKMTAQLNGSASGEALWKIASKHLPFDIELSETDTKEKKSFSLFKLFKRRDS